MTTYQSSLILLHMESDFLFWPTSHAQKPARKNLMHNHLFFRKINSTFITMLCFIIWKHTGEMNAETFHVFQSAHTVLLKKTVCVWAFLQQIYMGTLTAISSRCFSTTMTPKPQSKTNRKPQTLCKFCPPFLSRKNCHHL